MNDNFTFGDCYATFEGLLNALNDVNLEEETKWNYIELTRSSERSDNLAHSIHKNLY